MSKKQVQDKPGVFRTIIKVIMIIVFVAFGIILIAGGAMGLGDKINITIGEEKVKIATWVWALMITFGSMLLLSPIMLNRKATGFWWVFKIIFTIAFVLIGILAIVDGSVILAKGTVAKSAMWIPICNIVFGVMLLTSPIFLKK